jgi:hypothetical protein
MLQVKEDAPTPFFFCSLILGPTFGFLKEFGGVSSYSHENMITPWEAT